VSASTVSGEPDLLLLAALRERPADELLVLIGALTRGEIEPATLSALASEGVLPTFALDRPAFRAAGRQAADRFVRNSGDTLARHICPWLTDPAGRDLVLALGPAGLNELLDALETRPSVLTLALLAYSLTQLTDAICAGWNTDREA
jgi:hypothetical protein